MANKNTKEECKIGIIGLGVMGRNLLLNMAEKGFAVAGYDKDPSKVESLRQDSKKYPISVSENIREFIDFLKNPRSIMMLVPAGLPVDSVIRDLLPYLQKDDLIIDGGNSYFKDTNLRAQNLSEKGIQFLGIGISGGEEGARHGPSFMPGGPKQAYEYVRPIFEAAAAKVNNDPCVTYLGPGSAGHYVKMVHNGIEYGVMQLIAETYDLLKRGLGFNDDQLHDIYAAWNETELNSYLLEITSQIFRKKDDKTGKRLIDEILDIAKQKGTGMWTSQSGMELQVPIPTIDLAITMRNLSMMEKEREKFNSILNYSIKHFEGDQKEFLKQLQNAFYLGMMIVYAQGMELLKVASRKFDYQLDLKNVARIWRGGCIIRAKFLEDICKAYEKDPTLPNLLLDSEISKKVMMYEKNLRQSVCTASKLAIPVPCFMGSLSYLDSYRCTWLPANLIQAQRDYFGAHTFERNDKKGTFHIDWEKE